MILNRRNQFVGKTTIKNEIKVIESGTEQIGTSSNYWHWRKWSDGTAECWLKGSIANVAPTGTLSSVSYRVVTGTPFPTGLFVEEPVCNVNCKWDTGYSWASARDVYTDSMTYTICKLNNATANVYYVSIYVIGRWK